MRGGLGIAALAAVLSFGALSGCDSSAMAPRKTDVKPHARPAAIVPRPTPSAPETPNASQASRDLAAYYARVQSDLLVRGLLRTDGGGPDTQFTDTMLARDFEKIALKDEFARGEGLKPSSGEIGAIKKWVKPVRVAAEFGPSVPTAKAAKDKGDLASYVSRLGRITGHPIAMTGGAANFHVLFVSEDDRSFLTNRVRALVPDISDNAIGILERLPRGVHCLVFAFSDSANGYDYGQAIAVVRAEHPDLLRLSCIHEEVAQGLGLGNDDPRARPSIFNDDDEFALLTTHDELLLKILYDPRLRPGMSADQAMPIVRERAAELMGGDGPT